MTHAFATVAVLLAVLALCSHCLPAEFATDCLPEVPPKINASGATVTLQMHQWVWLENITGPDCCPRTETSSFMYKFMKPGVIQHQQLQLLGLRNNPPSMQVNLSFVAGENIMCAAALTVYRNQSDEKADTTTCNRICHTNFTVNGPRVNLPLLVLEDWANLTRSSEYLAIDSVDPESRASYNCMGSFTSNDISKLPSLMVQEKRCQQGDMCLFNYDNVLGLVHGGCKSDFRELSVCFSDLEICTYNVNGDCPICCRGDLCNRAVGQKVYQKWLDGKGASGLAASSVWLLSASAILSLLFLRSQH